MGFVLLPLMSALANPLPVYLPRDVEETCRELVKGMNKCNNILQKAEYYCFDNNQSKISVNKEGKTIINNTYTNMQISNSNGDKIYFYSEINYNQHDIKKIINYDKNDKSKKLGCTDEYFYKIYL